MQCTCMIQNFKRRDDMWAVNHEVLCPVMQQLLKFEKAYSAQLVFEEYYKISASDVAKRKNRIHGLKNK